MYITCNKKIAADKVDVTYTRKMLAKAVKLKRKQIKSIIILIF